MRKAHARTARPVTSIPEKCERSGNPTKSGQGMEGKKGVVVRAKQWGLAFDLRQNTKVDIRGRLRRKRQYGYGGVRASIPPHDQICSLNQQELTEEKGKRNARWSKNKRESKKNLKDMTFSQQNKNKKGEMMVRYQETDKATPRDHTSRGVAPIKKITTV